MTTHRDIVNALTRAGVLPYRVENVTASSDIFVAYIHFIDLPAEGENAECDAVFKKFAFVLAAKGVYFRA